VPKAGASKPPASIWRGKATVLTSERTSSGAPAVAGLAPGGNDTVLASPQRWRHLALLAVAQLLAMALWFSASAVVPQLVDEWHLSRGLQSWLTMSVQIGFVCGALVSALANSADRYPVHLFIAANMLLGSASNAAIPLFVSDPMVALALRFVTGFTLAGVYPPGMKIVASWCTHDRGLGIGVLVAAITIGSGLPHLLNAVALFGGTPGIPPWRSVLLATSACAVAGAVIMFVAVRPGPRLPPARAFHWRYAALAWRDPAVRLANFGYLGHMWELYAMWTWTPLFVRSSFAYAGWSEQAARAVGFAVIAIGGVGSVLAGVFADRMGRTRVTIASLATSGTCALFAGWLFDKPAALSALCLVWGFAVVADSAQFSTAVSELCDPRYVGTALTVQTSLGFLLTLLTIRLVPELVDRAGWHWAFVALVLGPVFGIVSMLRLRRLPAALRMAGGNR
jgi:MFS family permease